MLTFVKLGGSLITDKRLENSFRAETAARIASEIQAALAEMMLQLVIGHGSGSFGHVAASDMAMQVSIPMSNGVASLRLRQSHRTELLDDQVAGKCRHCGDAFQPSASTISDDGKIVGMSIDLFTALSNVDPCRSFMGCCLRPYAWRNGASTETIFFYLAILW
jgi:isopentenyl phosphate kinase